MKVSHDQGAELAQWLGDAVGHASTAGKIGRPELVKTWQSRTATLYHFAWPDPPLRDIVVKLHRSTAEAAAHFESMGNVARALEHADHPDIAVVKPLDISLDLRAVAMPLVAGRSLASHLVDRNWSSTAGQDEICHFVNRCGVLLASYHKGQPPATDKAEREATERLRTSIERAIGRDVELTSVRASGSVVRCYRDFHPGHVIVTPARKIALIDPPIEVQYDYFYRDLARFSHSLFKSLIEPRGLVRHPLRLRRWASLSDALLAGYTSAANRSLTDEDLFYVRSLEAYYVERMLRKARRRRSYILMAYYYAPMRYRLRELRRAMTRHLEQAAGRETQ